MELKRSSADGTCFFTACDEGANLALQFRDQQPNCLKIETDWISRSYGTRIEAPLISWTSFVELPFELQTVLYPYVGRAPSIEKLERLNNFDFSSLITVP